jgi:hypothetical protein
VSALATFWDAVIAVAIVLSVLLLMLAIVARRGRRVHLSVDIGRADEEDEPEPPVSSSQ